MNSCKEMAISEDFGDFIIDRLMKPPKVFSELNSKCSAAMSITSLCIYAPLTEVLPLSINNYPYVTIPSLFALEDTTALESSGILRLQNQPVLNLKGQGTVIGIIDTGIDYTHPAFKDALGSSRIISIWDQSNNTGTPPAGQFYGTEYSKEEINAALNSDNPLSIVPETDTIGHGTFIAGVAAGSENVNEGFIGAAPESELIVVKLKPAKQYLRDYYFIKDGANCFQENDIIFAISYITRKCLELDKPLSLCIGVGTNRGNHSGTGNLSFALNRLTENTSSAVSVSMGNEGNKQHHFSGNVSNNITPTTIELRIDESQKGLVMELWGHNPQIFSISITSPTGENIERVTPRLNTSVNYTFLFEETVLQIEYKLVESSSGEELILFRFINPTSGIWRINVYGENNLYGEFDAWLPMSEFVYENTYFLNPDPNITLTTPAAASLVMSVSNYNDKTNSISFESSRGFSRNGEVKPDFAAPGTNLLGPKAGTNSYTVRSGSSLSAAITAGAASLFQTWGIVNGNYPELKNNDIKSFLIRGAFRSNTEIYPNNQWGFGTLDVYNAFEVMRGN